MSDHPPLPTPGESPYVVEHFGFASTSDASTDVPGPRKAAAPHRRAGRAGLPARAGRRTTLVAGVLGLLLTSGVGVAAASAATGPDGHGGGGHGGVSLVADRGDEGTGATGEGPNGDG
jgi:hypothetical protein